MCFVIQNYSMIHSKVKMLLFVYPVLKIVQGYTRFWKKKKISPAGNSHHNVEQDAKRNDHANNEATCLCRMKTTVKENKKYLKLTRHVKNIYGILWYC